MEFTWCCDVASCGFRVRWGAWNVLRAHSLIYGGGGGEFAQPFSKFTILNHYYRVLTSTSLSISIDMTFLT